MIDPRDHDRGAEAREIVMEIGRLCGAGLTHFRRSREDAPAIDVVHVQLARGKPATVACDDPEHSRLLATSLMDMPQFSRGLQRLSEAVFGILPGNTRTMGVSLWISAIGDTTPIVHRIDRTRVALTGMVAPEVDHAVARLHAADRRLASLPPVTATEEDWLVTRDDDGEAPKGLAMMRATGLIDAILKYEAATLGASDFHGLLNGIFPQEAWPEDLAFHAPDHIGHPEDVVRALLDLQGGDPDIAP